MTSTTEARATAKEEARQRIQRILDTGKWPSGNPVYPAERELILANAKREGHEVIDRDQDPE